MTRKNVPTPVRIRMRNLRGVVSQEVQRLCRAGIRRRVGCWRWPCRCCKDSGSTASADSRPPRGGSASVPTAKALVACSSLDNSDSSSELIPNRLPPVIDPLSSKPLSGSVMAIDTSGLSCDCIPDDVDDNAEESPDVVDDDDEESLEDTESKPLSPLGLLPVDSSEGSLRTASRLSEESSSLQLVS